MTSEKKYEKRVAELLSRACSSRSESHLLTINISDTVLRRTIDGLCETSHYATGSATGRSISPVSTARMTTQRTDLSLMNNSLESSTSSFLERALTLKEKIKKLEESILHENSQMVLDYQSIPGSRPSTTPAKGKKKLRKKHAVIGCQKSEKIILADAAQHIMKAHLANEKRIKCCNDLLLHIDEMMRKKAMRYERWKHRDERIRRQKELLKIIMISCHSSILTTMTTEPSDDRMSTVIAVPKPVVVSDAESTANKRVAAAKKIRASITSWHARKVCGRYLQFMRSLKSKDRRWLLVIRMNIFRKRVAAKILRISLLEMTENQRVI
jgi:hypothetical protein